MARQSIIARLQDSDRMSQPKMTPMIDVVFQMLIFFIVAMQIRDPQGILKADLPRDRGDGLSVNPGEVPPPLLEVKVHLARIPSAAGDNSRIAIQIEQYKCRDLADLEHRLKLLSECSKRIPVIIDGEPEVPFAYIIGVVDACLKAELTQVRFTAPPPDEPDRPASPATHTR